MHSTVIADWRLADLRDPEGLKKFRGAVQHFLTKPDRLRARIHEYTTRSDVPPSAKDAVALFSEAPEADFGYERVFDIIDFTSTQKNSFDIVTVGSGLTFAPVMPGQKAKVYKFTGERVSVPFERYGGALQWDKTWFDDAEFWNIEDATQQFRNRWYSDRAQVFYDLISGSRSDSDVAWKGESSDTKAARDAETINYACADIIASLAGKGYDVNPQTRFVVIAPIQLVARVKNALNVSLLDTGSNDALNFNVEIVITSKLRTHDLSAAETGKYFVCLPGRKAKGGYRQELTLLAETDILAYAETVAAWGRYGGLVGDAAQFRRCATSGGE